MRLAGNRRHDAIADLEHVARTGIGSAQTDPLHHTRDPPGRGILRAMRLRLALIGWLVCTSACRGAHGELNDQPIDPVAAPRQDAPIQDAREAQAAALLDHDGAHFTPRAHYRIAARVLSTERYYRGWQSDLSPLDLALGWGSMSDPGVDKWISWQQGGRWYFWQWSADSPFENEAIRSETANVHIVPGTPNLRRALLALDEGDVIALTGWLVDIEGPSGARWATSVSRSDMGDGSCELLYVTELRTANRVYQ
jgi:hypothetical protein